MKFIAFIWVQLLLLVSSVSAWEPVIRTSDNPQYAYEVKVPSGLLLRVSSFARTQPGSKQSCFDDVTSLASVDDMGGEEGEWLERMIDFASLMHDPGSTTIARDGIWIGSGKSRRRRDKERCYALKKIDGKWRKVMSPCHLYKHFVCRSNYHDCLSSKVAFDKKVNSFKVYYHTPMCAKAEEMRMLSNFPNAFIRVNETENSMHFHFSSSQNYQTMFKRHTDSNLIADGVMVNLTGISGWIQWDENYEYEVPMETGSYPDFEYAYELDEYEEKEKKSGSVSLEEEEEDWNPLMSGSFDEYLQELRADLSESEKLPEDFNEVPNYFYRYIYEDERFQHSTKDEGLQYSAEDESEDFSFENEEEDDIEDLLNEAEVFNLKKADEEKVVDNQDEDEDEASGWSKKYTTIIILIVTTTGILLIVLYRFQKRTIRSYERNQILPIVVDRYPDKENSEWPSNWTRKKTGPRRNLHPFLNKLRLGLSRSAVQQNTLPTRNPPFKSASLPTV